MGETRGVSGEDRVLVRGLFHEPVENENMSKGLITVVLNG